jgi:cytochrome c peroxidase
MRRSRAIRDVAAALAIFAVTVGAAGAADLLTADSFNAITDRNERARALFSEAGKVLQHPRCLNCHPVGERPTQGNDMHPHQPLVVRGADDHGAIGMRCTTCHQGANFEPSGVPGHALWHVAPRSMAWQTKTLRQICEQIKDPTRNGGKTLAQIEEHMAHDSLVGWGWMPGGNREPAPGTQAQLGALISAWIASGAACPP